MKLHDALVDDTEFKSLPPKENLKETTNDVEEAQVPPRENGKEEYIWFTWITVIVWHMLLYLGEMRVFVAILY